jgi:hypothetical protein
MRTTDLECNLTVAHVDHRARHSAQGMFQRALHRFGILHVGSKEQIFVGTQPQGRAPIPNYGTARFLGEAGSPHGGRNSSDFRAAVQNETCGRRQRL